MVRSKKEEQIVVRITSRLRKDIEKYQNHFVNKKKESQCIRELLEGALDDFFKAEVV